jgi:hypothetical protein
VHCSDGTVKRRSILNFKQTAVEGRTCAITSIKGHLKVYEIKLGKGSGKSFREKVEVAIVGFNVKVQKVIISL